MGVRYTPDEGRGPLLTSTALTGGQGKYLCWAVHANFRISSPRVFVKMLHCMVHVGD